MKNRKSVFSFANIFLCTLLFTTSAHGMSLQQNNNLIRKIKKFQKDLFLKCDNHAQKHAQHVMLNIAATYNPNQPEKTREKLDAEIRDLIGHKIIDANDGSINTAAQKWQEKSKNPQLKTIVNLYCKSPVLFAKKTFEIHFVKPQKKMFFL